MQKIQEHRRNKKKHAGEFKQWKLAILYVTFPQSVLFILKANLTTRIPL